MRYHKTRVEGFLNEIIFLSTMVLSPVTKTLAETLRNPAFEGKVSYCSARSAMVRGGFMRYLKKEVLKLNAISFLSEKANLTK